MPALIPGDSSQYPTAIQTPVDGDTANAASVSTGLAQLADRTANLNARLVSGGGGGGAPTDATYLVASSNSTLTNETVVPAQGLTFLAATDAAGQRDAMDLGDSSTKDVGTTAGTVAAGNDSRITGAAQKASNLSDLSNAATARTNLGLAAVASSGAYSDLSGRPTLGSAAAADTDDFDAAGAASAAQSASLQKSSNLSDLTSVSTARTNLGAGSPSGLATLDSGGKVPTTQLPSVAITDTFVVNSQAAMLALTAERGDVAIRTDISTSFILSSDNPGTLADWKELLTPADGVTSFNGRTGAVSPAPGDYTASDVGALEVASNLGDLTDTAAARANLGLGDSAPLDVGTTAGTVAAGDDSRITGAAQKSANLSDLANAATARTNLGLGTAATYAASAFDAAGAAAAAQAASQPLDADLTAIAALASSANKVPYATGSGTWALADFTAAGRALLDDADAATQRTTLGLGTAAVLNAPASGDAASGEVVKGSDTRLSDTRTPTDNTVATAKIVDAAVTDAKLRTSAALSVIGRSANSIGNVADIAASSDGDVLRRSGTTLGFGAIPQASVTGLTTDLAGKASTGSVGSSGLTMGTGKVLGRSTSGSGAVEELTLGSGLSISGGVLDATSSGSGLTQNQVLARSSFGGF